MAPDADGGDPAVDGERAHRPRRRGARSMPPIAGARPSWHLPFCYKNPIVTARRPLAYAGGMASHPIAVAARPRSILCIGNAAARDRAGLLAGGWDASLAVIDGSGDALVATLEASDVGLLVVGDRPDVERLASVARAPLLVVRTPARLPYRRLIVAVDHSPRGARALDLLPAFAGAQVDLVHAFHLPFRDFIAGDPLGPEAARATPAAARPAEQLRGLRVDNRLGPPEKVLIEAVDEEDYELAIVATHGAHDLGVAPIGRTAAALLAGLPCDVLMVPTAG
jgi:nucleotide-binding universal stress UspA family protein